MKYAEDFDIFEFEFTGRAYRKTMNLGRSALYKLGCYVAAHFGDTMPTWREINNFVGFDCDKFFEWLDNPYVETEED